MWSHWSLLIIVYFQQHFTSYIHENIPKRPDFWTPFGSVGSSDLKFVLLSVNRSKNSFSPNFSPSKFDLKRSCWKYSSKGALCWEMKKRNLSLYLPIRALAQHFEQLELGGVCFLTALLHMVADVDLLQDAVVLEQNRTSSGFAVWTRSNTREVTFDGGDLRFHSTGAVPLVLTDP